MQRPVLLVDLDNVVYPWAEVMAQWLIENQANRGRDYRSLMWSYKTWSVWNDWDVPEGEFIRWWRLGIETGVVYKTGLPVPGSVDALWRLSDAEIDIHIATSRLTKFGLHDVIVENTASWLRDNNIPYRNVHFTDNKTAIRADAIIDDRADNMDSRVHGKVFEFPANHNQKRYVNAKEQRQAWEDIVNELT